MSERSWRERAEKVLLRPWPSSLRDAPEMHAEAPRFFRRAAGARLEDEDGRDWLDLEMGRGPNLLGYGHPRIEEALRRHLEVGAAHSSLFHHAVVEVAELLAALIPNVERVVFGKNGSDACTAAVRAARIATGKSTILSSGYHGFHDWFVSEQSHFAGFPKAYRGHLETFELNDCQRLEELVERNASDLACILIEPAHRLLPEPGFLATARRLADHHGALLVFDEVVTAFRLHPGGAQAAYGVEADLVCLGKAMANGLPISAIVGRQSALRHLDRTHFSMTFQHESFTLAAAVACLEHIRDTPVSEVIAARGEELRESFDGSARRYGIPARALGFPGRMDFDFPALKDLDSATQLRLFRQALLESGVLPAAACFVCEPFSQEDLERAGEAFDLAFERISQATADSRAKPQSAGNSKIL